MVYCNQCLKFHCDIDSCKCKYHKKQNNFIGKSRVSPVLIGKLPTSTKGFPSKSITKISNQPKSEILCAYASSQL